MGGKKQVGSAVVVEVAPGRALHKGMRVQPGAMGHLGEGAVAVVVKEAVGEAAVSFLEAGDGGAVGEEEVQEAVVIVVEHGDAARHGLDRVAVGADAAP